MGRQENDLFTMIKGWNFFIELEQDDRFKDRYHFLDYLSFRGGRKF